VSNYWYDAAGERTVKSSGDGEGIFVNGVLSGARTGTTNFTAYVNPYVVISNGGQCSKHFYIGSQRIVSKLCSYAQTINSLLAEKETAYAGTGSYSVKYDSLTGSIKARYASLGVIYKGTSNTKALYSSATTTPSDLRYFYHSDHLGSSSLITNFDGAIVQHIEYVPFGEVFIEERNSTWKTPYKFNAKELDEETGLYYYGARYMDPRISVWLGVDPLAEKYPDISSYVYCFNNPLIYIDPTGQEGVVVSGQPGDHKNKEHFLVNGLDRAVALQNQYDKQGNGEKATLIIYNGGDGGYSKETIDKYQDLAGKAGISLQVVTGADQIVDYVNNKTGGDSRSNDLISNFTYVGHATPGDLDAGFVNHGFWNLLTNEKVEPSSFSANAFKSGCTINVVGACRTAIDGNLPGEKSVIDQFAEKVDSKSTIMGSDVRVGYMGGVRSNKQLVNYVGTDGVRVNGHIVTKKGRRR
jgi:RHS repeat-associated protein